MPAARVTAAPPGPPPPSSPAPDGTMEPNRGYPIVWREPVKSSGSARIQQMSTDPFSLSIFTLEADNNPILSFAARTQAEAELVQADPQLRAELRAMKAGGAPLCDNYSLFRVRIARPVEAARYREATLPATTGLRVFYWSILTRRKTHSNPAQRNSGGHTAPPPKPSAWFQSRFTRALRVRPAQPLRAF